MFPQHTSKRAGKTLEDRFWAKVDKSNDCWIWTGLRSPKGYGVFWLHGRRWRTHRITYQFLVAPIPDGMDVCHECDNPPCCNPDHLFIGTRAENILDCVQKGRHVRGEQVGTAKLSTLDVINIRQLHASGTSTMQIAECYNVAERTVRNAVRRRTWRHLP
jgi:hypothetical protein